MRQRQLLVLLPLLLAANGMAQWAASPIRAGSTVLTEGFNVVATAPGIVGDDALVFSAITQAWRNLGPVHADPAVAAPAIQSGDWTVLVRQSIDKYRAYSARLDQFADITFLTHPDKMIVCVSDDVILMVGLRPQQGAAEACAYSAQTNQWRYVTLCGTPPVAYAYSQFVIGILDRGGLYGFSARYGEWVNYPGADFSLEAKGNVLLAKPMSPAAPVLAFSGVLGQWSMSPPQDDSSGPTLDHNVAYLRAADVSWPDGANCGYSAYSGLWQLGGPAGGIVTMTRNAILVTEQSADHQTFLAFGARPGNWNRLNTLGNEANVVSEADWLAVDDRRAKRLYGFSGLCAGGWSGEAYVNEITVYAEPQNKTCDSVLIGRDSDGCVHAFSPMTAAWAAIQPGLGAKLTLGASFAIVDYPANRWSYSTRSNEWVLGPMKNPAADYVQAGAGAVYAECNVLTGELAFWHERQNKWLTAQLPVLGVPEITGTGNVLVVNAATMSLLGPVIGFSAERGDWFNAPPFIPVGVPTLDDHVAWFLGTDARIHAFASPVDTNSWFNWPLGTEYQVLTPAAPNVPLKVMLKGKPGDSAVLILGPAPLFQGIGLPPLGGKLLIDPLFQLIIEPVGVIQPNGLLPGPVQMYANLPAYSLGIWAQGFMFDSVHATFLGPVPEPIRFF